MRALGAQFSGRAVQTGMRQREHLVGNSLRQHFVCTVLRMIEYPFLKRLQIAHRWRHFDLGQSTTEIARFYQGGDFGCPGAGTCHGVFFWFPAQMQFFIVT